MVTWSGSCDSRGCLGVLQSDQPSTTSLMSAPDIRSAVRPDPGESMVDIVDYAVDYGDEHARARFARALHIVKTV